MFHFYADQTWAVCPRILRVLGVFHQNKTRVFFIQVFPNMSSLITIARLQLLNGGQHNFQYSLELGQFN